MQQVSLKGRVVVRSDIIFEPPDPMQKIVAWGENRTWEVESDERAYERVIKVGEDWTPLDYSWIERPSILYLVNPEERFSVNPTPKQQAEVDAKVIEVALGDALDRPFALIRPGRDMQIEPAQALTVRCRRGITKLQVVAVPS